MVNLLGGELVFFEYLRFSNSFMNSFIILLNPHVACTPEFFILNRISKLLVLVPGGDSPPRVTPRLVNPPIEITNWLG